MNLRSEGITGLLAGLLWVSATTVAYGHGANPAVAWLDNPIGVGTVVDTEFAFTWVDFDMPIPTGTATIDFHYAARRPPAYQFGEIHPLLEGTPIVQGIFEKSPDNAYTWDTSNVASGTYHIWSEVIEPPEENMAPQIISFSPGVVTIAHPGDPVHPALVLTTPDTPFRFADESYVLRWKAFDPHGTGLVKIEVGTSSLGADFETLAEGLDPAAEEYLWDTAELQDEDWYIRATISDDQGLSFVTYAQYLLLVSHPEPETDAGIVDAGSGSVDAGLEGDGGFVKTGSPDSCRCISGETSTQTSNLWLPAGLLMVLGAGRRRANKRARR